MDGPCPFCLPSLPRSLSGAEPFVVVMLHEAPPRWSSEREMKRGRIEQRQAKYEVRMIDSIVCLIVHFVVSVSSSSPSYEDVFPRHPIHASIQH